MATGIFSYPSSFRVLPATALRTAFLAFAAAMFASLAAAANPAPKDVHDLLVDAAHAEAEGNTAAYLNSLNEALALEPENQVAHWALGQIQTSGGWLSIEELLRRDLANPLVKKYYESRDKSEMTLADQLQLARWCRKNKLTKEGEIHWANVLALDPGNKEALHVCNLRWVDDQLWGRTDVEAAAEASKNMKKVSGHWKGQIAAWRKAIAGRDPSAREEAIHEISTITRRDAIPFLETVTLSDDSVAGRNARSEPEIAIAFLAALDKMPEQIATDSITKHAVMSPSVEVRFAATQRLKARSPYDYVPQLINCLKMPVQSVFRIVSDADGNTIYSHRVYREGPQSDQAFAADFASEAVGPPATDRRDYVFRRGLGVWQDQTNPKEPKFVLPPVLPAKYRFAVDAAEIERQVAKENAETARISERIIPILNMATDKNFETPKEWWDWWRDNNEYESRERRVEFRYDFGSEYFQPRPYDTYRSVPSCFVKGTPVWTKRGLQPIETLAIGDLVLSQNPTTGEIDYKCVIGTTVRPPSPILKVSMPGETINATKGHPFWVAGAGWQMAKELAPGANIHSISGGSPVRSVEPVADAEAFNLIVADFNTYFVGETGLLVHDNSARHSVPVITPGIAAK